MNKGRLEAFSDGVIAIIITIMVLELAAPEGDTLAVLRPVVPKFLSYVLSFVFLGIYWNNHHHLFQATERVDGRVLWANLHLLFWLSLVPFVTSWMSENGFSALPIAFYGAVQLLAAVAFTILVRVLISIHAEDTILRRAIGADVKGKLSLFFYFLAIPVAFFFSWLSILLFVIVDIMWLIPDRRIENIISQ